MPRTPEGTARRKFIERWVISPEITLQEIADTVDCSIGYVIKVANKNKLLEVREANRLESVKRMRSGIPKLLMPGEK